jgi:CHAT domain-containing protein/HEAT repeat protein
MRFRILFVLLLVVSIFSGLYSQHEERIITEKNVYKYKLGKDSPFDIYLLDISKDINYMWRKDNIWGGFICVSSKAMEESIVQENHIYGDPYIETAKLNDVTSIFCSRKNYNELITDGKTLIQPYARTSNKPREFKLDKKDVFKTIFNGKEIQLKAIICSALSGEKFIILENKDYPLILRMELDFTVELTEIITESEDFFNLIPEFHQATIQYLSSDSTLNLSKVEEVLKKVKQIKREDLQLEWGFKLGMTYASHKKIDEAHSSLLAAIEGIDETKFVENFIYQKVLGNIALYYSDIKNYRTAIDYYLKLFELEKQNLVLGKMKYAKYMRSVIGKLTALYKRIDKPDSSNYYYMLADSTEKYFYDGVNDLIINKKYRQAINRILNALQNAEVYDEIYNTLLPKWESIPSHESYNIVFEVLQNMQSSKAQKYAAFNILYSAGTKKDIPQIVDILAKEPDFDIAQGLAGFIVSNAGRSSIPILLKLAFDENATENARFKAIWWFGDIKDKSIVPDLLKLAENTDNERLLFALAQRLGELGDPKAIPFILKYMKDFPESWQVIWALENMPPSKELLEMLHDRLKNGIDYNVRDEAAKTLGAIGNETSIPHLKEAMKDENEWVRYYSAEALWRLGDNYGMKYLIEHDMRADDINIDDNTATDYVSRTKDQSLFEDLKKNLINKDPKVRQMAIRSLGNIGNPSAIPILYKILDDIKEDENVKAEAIISLGLLREKKILPRLSFLIMDDTHRWRAAACLHQFVDRSVYDTLKYLFNINENDDVKEVYAVALSILKDADGIKFMRDRILSKNGPFLTRFEKVYPHLNFSSKEIAWIIENPSPNWYWEYLRKILFVNKSLKDFEEIQEVIKSTNINAEIKADISLEYATASREVRNHEMQLTIAEEVLLKAKELDSYRLIVESLWLTADAKIYSQKFDEAESDLMEAIKYCNELTSSERWSISVQFPEAYTHCLLGELYLAKKNFKKAFEYYELAATDLSRTPSGIIQYHQDEYILLGARVSSGKGAALIELGKNSFKEAIDGFEKVETKGIREKESRDRAYLGLIKSAIGEGNYEEAQKLSEKLILLKLNEDFSKMRVNPFNPDRKKEMEELVRRKQEIEDAKKEAEKETDKKDMTVDQVKQNKQREFKKYINTLKKENPKLFTIVNSEPSNLKEIQDAGIIPDNMAVLQYLIGEEELYIFVVTNLDLIIKKVDVKQSMLSKLVYKFRTQIKNQVVDDQFDQTAEELYRLLIEPVESELKGIDYVGIIPNQQLYYLPFSTLRKKDDTKYLFETYKIFFMNSTSLLGIVGQQKLKCNMKNATFSAYANADGSLPEAENEIKTISALYTKPNVFYKDEAKKEKVISTTGCKILQFATHGVTFQNEPTNSYLVLAPKGEQGKLTVEEVWGLDLKDCPLVILSACETAEGELIAGDEVVSLAFGFIYAGSSSCAATLWRVESQSTGMIMEEFHKSLKQNKSRIESLQDAMKKVKEKYPHPFYWSPFVLLGDWR